LPTDELSPKPRHRGDREALAAAEHEVHRVLPTHVGEDHDSDTNIPPREPAPPAPRDRRPATNQPRSQPAWAGHLATAPRAVRPRLGGSQRPPRCRGV